MAVDADDKVVERVALAAVALANLVGMGMKERAVSPGIKSRLTPRPATTEARRSSGLRPDTIRFIAHGKAGNDRAIECARPRLSLIYTSTHLRKALDAVVVLLQVTRDGDGELAVVTVKVTLIDDAVDAHKDETKGRWHFPQGDLFWLLGLVAVAIDVVAADVRQWARKVRLDPPHRRRPTVEHAFVALGQVDNSLGHYGGGVFLGAVL